jgi:hypothetical protein
MVMKNRFTVRAALLLLFSLLIVASAPADTFLGSGSTATDSNQSNSNGATVDITRNIAWAPALYGSSWVSFGLTGDASNPGFFVVPNGTKVSFFDIFNVAGTPTGGTLSVMADDSASVFLNGVLLQGEASGTNNKYTTCSDFGIGCVKPTTFNISASDLHSGSNTLRFDVAQRMGSSYGLDYAGDVTSTPEPSSVSLLGFGLLTLAGGLVFRKREAVA